MRKELVRRVLEEVHPHLGTPGGKGSAGNGAADLLHAVSAIHAGTTQKEVLRALLENTASYCGRAALFVIKSGSATGWQGRGFDNNEDFKDFSLDVSSRAPARLCKREPRLAQVQRRWIRGSFRNSALPRKIVFCYCRSI